MNPTAHLRPTLLIFLPCCYGSVSPGTPHGFRDLPLTQLSSQGQQRHYLGQFRFSGVSGISPFAWEGHCPNKLQILPWCSSGNWLRSLAPLFFSCLHWVPSVQRQSVASSYCPLPPSRQGHAQGRLPANAGAPLEPEPPPQGRLVGPGSPWSNSEVSQSGA